MGHEPYLHKWSVGSFEELYRETVGRVHSLARNLLGQGRADEATQEVFLRAWRKRGTLRTEAASAAWLHQVARNELINQARAHGRLTRDHSAESFEEGSTAAKDDATRASDLRLDLERALTTLPSGARTVFVLYDIEGMAHADIAHRLGISIGTSKSQLHRARALLRVELFPWSEVKDD